MNTIDRKFQIKLLKEIGKVKPHSALMFPTSTTPLSPELLPNLNALVAQGFVYIKIHNGDEGRIDAIMADITEKGREFLTTLSD